MRHVTLLLYLLVLLATGCAAGEQKAGSAQNEPPQPVVQRIQAIRRDLAKTDGLPFWAGKYFEGDGLGMNISLYVSPTAGFAFTNYGCLGLYGAGEGDISVQQDGSLKFAFHTPQSSTSSDFPGEVIPVRWGERIYLLPRERMYEFVLAVNRGFEQLSMPGGGMFLNNKMAIHGMPDLPQPYLAALRQKAVDAKILHVVRTAAKTLGKLMCQMRYEVTIDRGASSGLSSGEMLAVVEPKDAFVELTLVHTTETEATGSLSVIEADCNNPKETPMLDWKLSTFAVGEINKKAP